MPGRRRATSSLVLSAWAAAAMLVLVGVVRFKDYVDNDPRLCAQCHQASPEFALWQNGSHKSVACQKCHHSTPSQAAAMLRAFLAGADPNRTGRHAQVEVGACASCHLSHDPRWPQIGGSRGHRIHVEQHGIACVRCHAAAVHGFAPVSASCQGCHGVHAVRAPGMQQLHCFACHNFLSTDPGLAPGRQDCLRCHRAQGVLPARFAEDGPMQFQCGACHKPHAATREQELIDCRTCHAGMARAGLHGEAGHGRCLDCHQAHLWRSEPSTCLRCHAGAPAHARGRSCEECHGFQGAPRPAQPR